MSGNHRDNTINMDWRIIHELWMRFCYETQNPTRAEIDNIIVNLQPLLCELQTTLKPQTVKIWFGNTRQRPYPSLSIRDIDSARTAHRYLIEHVPITGAAQRNLNAWLKKGKGPAITANNEYLQEQKIVYAAAPMYHLVDPQNIPLYYADAPYLTSQQFPALSQPAVQPSVYNCDVGVVDPRNIPLYYADAPYLTSQQFPALSQPAVQPFFYNCDMEVVNRDHSYAKPAAHIPPKNLPLPSQPFTSQSSTATRKLNAYG